MLMAIRFLLCYEIRPMKIENTNWGVVVNLVLIGDFVG